MLKHCFTIWCAKCIRFACKLAHKQGVTLAGAFALKFNPSIVTYLADQIPTTIAICGTNGKTTTNNLMALALESNQCDWVKHEKWNCFCLSISSKKQWKNGCRLRNIRN